MKKIVSILFFVLLIACTSDKKQTTEEFLRKEHLSAKDYVLSLFKENDIVIICERDHQETTQYELFMSIIEDSFFIKNVGHVYTEFGVANADKRINKFLSGNETDSTKTHNQITKIFRDVDFSPYWHCTNFPMFLKKIKKINKNLTQKQKIQLHPCDVKFDWNKCRTIKQYQKWDEYTNRDTLLYLNFVEKFDSIYSSSDNRKKALVIMNYSHSFLPKMYNGTKYVSFFAHHIKQKYQKSVASVYLMGLAYPNNLQEYTLIQNGKWDYLLNEKSNGKSVGFNLKNTPFGSTLFDVWPQKYNIDSLKYQDVFTGLLFYKSIKEHKLSVGWKGYISENFLTEFWRRCRIYYGANEENVPKQQLEKVIQKLNEIETFEYDNIDSLQRKIDNWKQGKSPKR